MLQKFLSSTRVTDKTADFNVLSLRGGKFNVREHQYLKFLRLFYKKAVRNITPENSMSLVWRTHGREYLPITLDFDCIRETAEVIPNEEFQLLARDVTRCLVDASQLDLQLGVFLTRKPVYEKMYKGKKCFKTGVHLYLIGMEVTRRWALQQYETLLKPVAAFCERNKIINPAKNVLDKLVQPFGKNGMLFSGDYKKEGTGRYYIFLRALFSDGEYADVLHYTEDQRFETFEENYDMLYSFLTNYVNFQTTPIAKIDLEEPEHTKKEPKRRVISTDDSTMKFDLQYFLGLVRHKSDAIPHDDWLKLAMFCRICQLDETCVVEQLNEVFKPSDLEENLRVYRSYSGEDDVTEGSIVRILNCLNIEFDKTKLFPARKYRFHNDHCTFLGEQEWDLFELERFVTEVYSYCWGSGSTKFIYQERNWKTFGVMRYQTISTVITENLPFGTAKSDILVLVKPILQDYIKCLKTAMKSQKHLAEKCLKELTNIKSDNNKCKHIHTFLGDELSPHAKERSLGQIFLKTKQRGKLKNRYHSYTLVPYLDENPVASDCLNIWPGFSLHRFRNTDVDLKSTAIWEWLWVVWADRTEYKLRWLINYFAHKVKQPHRKICKFLVAYCRPTGCGKTTVRFFCEALLDKDKVLFCKNLNEYLAEQNAEQLNKLIVLIDDIERATVTESNALKSSITGDTIRLKKLYSDPITLPSYCDLIATSNERTPVFISDQNRRNEMIVINPEKKGDIKFFDKFYAELKDSKIMGAFFEFFATYKIDINVRSEAERFDIEVLSAEKLKSMKSTHQWVVNFFCDQKCFENACTIKFRAQEGYWWDDLLFKIIDNQRVCMIKKARAYVYYQFWAKESGMKNIVKKSTFEQDLADLDIRPIRKQFKNGKPRVYVFNKPRVKKTIACFYQVESRLVKLQWVFTDPEEFAELTLGRFRFRTDFS